MKAWILAYHSHRVLGDDYARNDHVALAADLEVIHEAGGRIVPLDTIVDALDMDTENDLSLVALTFDDGPIYDFVDFTHPRFGRQRSFAAIMRDFASARALPVPHATSFVIASPEARRCMETTYDPAHSFVATGALDDGWWNEAIDCGSLSIANHSFDHLHDGLPRVAHSAQARGDFTRVLSVEDADAQLAAAARYIGAKTRGRAAPWFAYPFGHYNRFLTHVYLPANASRLGLRAAFTTDPRPVVHGDNRWCLPRFVCGHHWTSPEELRAILAS
jgi:peptidoglycan/xylan/chitin deacetylase (PgdA/CDA1 family)